MAALGVAALLLFSAINTASAQDRSLARTYQSNVLPKGAFDIELWNTFRTGKKGDFSPYEFGNRLDQRAEFEVGLGGNLQTAFYMNVSRRSLALIGGTGITHSVSTSFSNEWKWKLSDPSVDALGSALYGEITVASHEIELEGKVILDKRFGNELIAFNLVGEYEMEYEFEADEGEVETEWKAPIEIDLGYMHFFTPGFGLGLEVVSSNEIVPDEGWAYSALFAGPTIFVAHDKVFGALNIMPQLANLHKTDEAPGDLVLTDHEKLEMRLLVGFTL